jgi:uncharacterized protein
VTQFAPPSDRTRVRRLAKRAEYDPEVVRAILDEALVAHVGIITDHGPIVLPMTFARIDSTLYLHGAAANALLAGADGAAMCVSVMLLDGLVLARSMFHHSMNFRSVTIFGTGQRVRDAAECVAAATALTNKICPGRGAEARPPTDIELKATTFIALPIDEASAKIRTGPPIDDEEDMAMDIWAGVVPVTTSFGEPARDEFTPAERHLRPHSA